MVNFGEHIQRVRRSQALRSPALYPLGHYPAPCPSTIWWSGGLPGRVMTSMSPERHGSLVALEKALLLALLS